MVSPSVLPKVVDEASETTPRRAKWWYVTFHNVTAMVGAGVLSLPYAMAHLGWDGGAAGVVGDHAVHAAAADRAARVRAGRAVRPVPRPRRARAGPAARPVGGGAAAAHRAARLRHGVHGHRRQVPAEVRRVGVPHVHAAAPVLLDLHLRLLPVPSFPAPQPQLHHRRLPHRRRHVSQLLDHIVGGVPGAGAGGRGELRVQGRHGGGLGVPGVQRAGAGGVRVRGARRGSGDPGHDPVHADKAVQGAHVEGHRRGVPGHRHVLLPRRARRVLGVRPRRQRQRARGAAAAALARRRGQHDGGHPRHGKLSGVRHANIRKPRNNSDHKIQGSSRGAPPSGGSISLRRIHALHRGDVPVLRRPPRLLGGLRVHADVVLPPLRSVAEDQEATEVQCVVVRELGVHHYRSNADDCFYYRRVKKHHPGCLDVPVLLLMGYEPATELQTN